MSPSEGRQGAPRKAGEVRRLVLFVPITILLLEHVLVPLYWLDTTQHHSAATASFLHEPHSQPKWGRLLPATRTSASVPLELSVLTQSSVSSSHNCSKNNLLWIRNAEVSSLHSTKDDSSISKIIHQTSKTRCLTSSFADASQQWQKRLPDWSYYLHDDEAVMRLLQHHSNDFPGLDRIIQQCVLYGTLRADIWRYLVLWVYGGLYADLDAVPANLTAAHLQEQDAVFVVEQYHMLSQYFIAVTPRHPLMWYALQQALANVQRALDTQRIAAAMYTGPHALHQAWTSFRADVGVSVEPARTGTKPVRSGQYLVGTHNRTVTVLGVAERQNEYVNRDVIGRRKRRDYARLGMTFHQDDHRRQHNRKGESCWKRLLDAYY